MSWFWIAIIAPLCWAVVNHIDKYLLEKHFRNHGVGTLVLFSSLFGFVMLPIAYGIEPASINAHPWGALLLMVVGIISGLAIYCYLSALKVAETSIVIPIFQTIPIFGFVFAYIFLGELLTYSQIYAGLLIIFGALIISLEIEEEKRIRPKLKPLLLMLISSALYGLHETLFKLSALENNFWTSVFWLNIGLVIFGLFIFWTRKSDRDSFIRTFRAQPGVIVGVNILSEGLTMIGNLALFYAMLLAPVAMVQLTMNFQPLMVLVIGVLLTIFLPHIATEKITKRHLLHKATAIATMLIGVILLYN